MSSSNCQGCGKPDATLACPTCLKLGFTQAKFCGQDCFKANWPVHKLTHQVAAPSLSQTTGEGNLLRFANYEFSGKLRPALVTPQKVITDSAIKKPDYADSGIPESELKRDRSNRIPIPTPAQMVALRESCAIARDALDLGGSMIRPGVTGEDIDTAIHDFIVSKGGYPSPLNYHKFPKSICTSVNEVICHGIPDLRPLEEGDIINLDISVYFKGMHSDVNETFICGKTDKESQKLVETTYACLMEAIKQCKPGALYRDLGNTITKIAGLNGLSVVRTYCGHGVGEYFHSAPNIPHYANNKAVGVMAEGHVFTIEPMINVGSWKDRTWPDNWTSSTVDGKRSAQFEHTLLITKDGVEILTARKSDSPSLGFDTEKLAIKK